MFNLLWACSICRLHYNIRVCNSNPNTDHCVRDTSGSISSKVDRVDEVVNKSRQEASTVGNHIGAMLPLVENISQEVPKILEGFLSTGRNVSDTKAALQDLIPRIGEIELSTSILPMMKEMLERRLPSHPAASMAKQLEVQGQMQYHFGQQQTMLSEIIKRFDDPVRT